MLLAIAAILCLGIESYWARWSGTRHDDSAIPFVPVPRYIAHAGGGIGNQSYTNSREAFDANYLRGFRVFETDFNWTSDDQLVLIHDWEALFEDQFSQSKGAPVPSLSKFLHMKMKGRLTPMSFAELADWLRKHRDARIVTDVKDGNLRALKRISEEFPDLVERIIPQIYTFEEYDPVRGMGYGNIILTLYVKNYADEPVVRFAENQKLFGVTIWKERAKGALPKKLAALKTAVFAHTVNSLEEEEELEANGVSGIYTDFLFDDK